jgi:hypothetical protein
MGRERWIEVGRHVGCRGERMFDTVGYKTGYYEEWKLCVIG